MTDANRFSTEKRKKACYLCQVCYNGKNKMRLGAISMIKVMKQRYHWVIAALVFIEMTVFGGLLNSANVFIIPVCETLQETRGNYAISQIPYNITCFLSSMVTGYVFQHFGYKKPAIISLALICGSLVLTAVSQSLVMYGISKVIMAMGYGVCFTAGSVRIVKAWFWKHQGLVLGAVSMASGLGGSLMTIVLTDIIQTRSWRAAHIFAAVAIAVIAVSYLLLKDSPEQKNLKPFGYGTPPAGTKKAREQDHDWPGYTMKALLRHPAFYLMALCTLASCSFVIMTSGVIVVHFQDIGYTPEDAAMFQSLLMLCLAVAKLAAGGLCDKIGAKAVTILCMICAVVGQILLSSTTERTLCAIGVGVFSVGMCMTSILIPLLAAPLFGYRACISVNGIFLAMSSLGGMIASPVSNILYDTLGSYNPVFRIAAVSNTVLIGIYLLLFAAAKRDKRKYYAAIENRM